MIAFDATDRTQWRPLLALRPSPRPTRRSSGCRPEASRPPMCARAPLATPEPFHSCLPQLRGRARECMHAGGRVPCQPDDPLLRRLVAHAQGSRAGESRALIATDCSLLALGAFCLPSGWPLTAFLTTLLTPSDRRSYRAASGPRSRNSRQRPPPLSLRLGQSKVPF